MKGHMDWGHFVLPMDIWVPRAVCQGDFRNTSEGWVRIFGIPAHLWCLAVFRVVGDMCQGFLEANTVDDSFFEWVRVKVMYPERCLSTITNDGW